MSSEAGPVEPRTATMGGRMGLESALWHFRMRSRLHLKAIVCHDLEINLSKLAAAAVRICTLHFATLTNTRGVMDNEQVQRGLSMQTQIRWQQSHWPPCRGAGKYS